jgi:hypothetical protein
VDNLETIIKQISSGSIPITKSESASSSTEITLVLKQLIKVSYFSNLKYKDYSLSVFPASVEQKFIDLANSILTASESCLQI